MVRFKYSQLINNATIFCCAYFVYFLIRYLTINITIITLLSIFIEVHNPWKPDISLFLGRHSCIWSSMKIPLVFYLTAYIIKIYKQGILDCTCGHTYAYLSLCVFLMYECSRKEESLSLLLPLSSQFIQARYKTMFRI